MASHSIEINKGMAGIAALAAAISFAYVDNRYGLFGEQPLRTFIIAGLVGLGFAYVKESNAAIIILLSAVVFGLGTLGNS